MLCCNKVVGVLNHLVLLCTCSREYLSSFRLSWLEHYLPFSYYAGSSNSNSLLFSNHSRTYNDCFVEALITEAEKDKDIVVVHAGMEIDPSLQLFQEKFPDKYFDVGMAEQHAVTFSAGLSCGGLKPFCIIPSAFLQRAYDQVCSLLSCCACLCMHRHVDSYDCNQIF